VRVYAPAGAVAAVGIIVGSALWHNASRDTPLSRREVVEELHARKPPDVPEAAWSQLLAAVGSSLSDQAVETLSPHEAEMVARSLEELAGRPFLSPEKLRYEEALIRWALPRFLPNAPTEGATSQLIDQIEALARWASESASKLDGVGRVDDEAEAALQRWKDDLCVMAWTFRTGCALHPVAEGDLAQVRQEFLDAYRGAREGNQTPVGAMGAACDAATAALLSKSARPKLEAPPPEVAQLLAPAREATVRLIQQRQRENERKFRTSVMREEVRKEREDLEAWALMLDGAELQRMVGVGRQWACRFEVGIGKRTAVAVWAEQTETGSVVLRTPRVADPSPSKWRWENRDVEVDAERLYVRQAPVGAQTWVPLEAPPPTELVHYTEDDWAKALAAQAPTSRRLWEALAPYLQGAPEKTGATDLSSPIGVLPFMATPAVQRLDRAKPGEPVRLLSAEGQEVGTVRCEYGFREDALMATPSVITLELGSRTVTAAATMRVKHGADETPTEERWSAPVPAEVRKVVFRLAASAPAAALQSIVASDEKGQALCTIGVTDLAFD
jgi:hypothetical protein